MINSAGTESKYGLKLTIPNSTGVVGSSDGESVFAETKVRLEVLNVGPTFTMDVEGQVKNSPNWYPITTITGAITGTLDISTYDRIRYNVTTSDGVGVLVSSGFMLNVSSGGGGGGGGDASAANQVAGNATLTQINNKTPGSLLANKVYDNIQMAYTATTDVFSYYNGATLTATTTITYTDNTKAIITRVQRV